MRRLSDFVQVEVRPAKGTKQRGTHTDSGDDTIWCSQGCGRKVKSKLGTVCSNRNCQQNAAAGLDSFGGNKPRMITSGRR